jgi:Flp pilus assembly protein TadD
LRRLLKTQPENAEALHLLGMALARSARGAEGIDFLRKATRAKPLEALYWNNLAASCLGLESFSEAADAARRAVELDPTYGMAWDNLGSALMDLKDSAGAQTALSNSIRLGTANLQTLKRASACAMTTNDLASAETWLRSAMNDAPDELDILSNLGAVLMARGQLPDAKEILSRAVLVNPDHHLSALHYGAALVATGDRPAGLRWMRRATSADHKAVDGWRLLGETLLAAGEMEEAVTSLERAAALAPQNTAIAALLERARGGKAGMAGRAPAQLESGADPCVLDFQLPAQSAPKPATVAKPVAPAEPKVAASTPGALEFTLPAINKPAKKAGTTGVIDLTILDIK